ncbi:MAG TPA: type VII secretion protein EccE [Rugosimonospora sp.]
MQTLRDRAPVSGRIVAARIVAAQAAVLALLLAALGGDPLGWLVAVPVAGSLVALGFLRWRHRWLHAWLATGLRYLTRARTLPAGAGPAALLRFVEPTACQGAEPGVIEDSDGVVAILELGDGGPELGDGGAAHPGVQPALPSPAELVATVGAGAVALIVSAVPAGGTGPAGASYRQLTDGRTPARQRVLLAVRASRVDVAWSADDLRRSLAGSLRRIGRRLRQDEIVHRQLSAGATGAVLAELALHHPGAMAREGWAAIQLGGLHQTSLRVPRLDRLPVEVTEQLIARLLALPAASTTIGLCASSGGTELVVRVAAGTRAGLAGAVASAYRLLSTAGSVPERLDGRQLTGLAATLPLARPPDARPGTGRGPGTADTRPERGSGAAGTGPGNAPGAGPRFTPPPSGLVLGHNRHHQPVTVRLFRPEPTRAMMLGGVRAAQVLALRALALNAQVTVQTVRPQAWEPFLRAVSLPTGAVAVVPPGSPAPPAPAGPLVPQLVVVDAAVAARAAPPAPWRATLVLREEASAADVNELSRADLVILQSLRPGEAALVGTALGLDASRDWLSRIRADMVGVVSRLGAGRSAVRWAVLSTTDIERHVIGAPERVTIG